MNNVVLVGRAGQDPEMKYFESGKVKTTFSVAVNRWDSKVKEEVTDVVKVAYETLKIMYDIYPDLLKERYGVDMEIQAEEDEGYFQDPFYDIFLAMAKKRGCILSGGRIDEERFARLFLNDLREGRTGRITLEMPEDYK